MTERVQIRERACVTSEVGKRHYVELDGLRGVAALAVVIGHTLLLLRGSNVVLPHIDLAVHFFFMLSGFVIARAYGSRLQSGGITVGDFLIRRAIRLYPLIVAGAVLGSLYFQVADTQFKHQHFDAAVYVAKAFAVIPTLTTDFRGTNFPINPPEWSLFFEIVCYVLFGLFASRIGAKLLIVFAGVFLGLYAYFISTRVGPYLPLYMQFFGAAASFIIGVILWRWREHLSAPILKMPFAVLAVILFSVCAIPDKFDWIILSASILLVFPALMLLGSSIESGGRLERWLGDISYPVYILHWPIILIGKKALIKMGYNPSSWVFVCLCCAVILAVSWLTFRLFDVPTRAWLTKSLLPARAEPGLDVVRRGAGPFAPQS